MANLSFQITEKFLKIITDGYKHNPSLLKRFVSYSERNLNMDLFPSKEMWCNTIKKLHKISSGTMI